MRSSTGAAYATTDSMRHTLYYTQRNAGKFIIVETKAPTGYFGDWTDINHPGMANTPLGKRGYYIEITKDKDNSVIWLDNADYNADVAAADKGGTKLVTSTGVETTVTIYDTSKDPRRTYNTDNSGKAANEDSYTITPTDRRYEKMTAPWAKSASPRLTLMPCGMWAAAPPTAQPLPAGRLTAMPRWTARCMTSTPPKILRTPMV